MSAGGGRRSILAYGNHRVHCPNRGSHNTTTIITITTITTTTKQHEQNFKTHQTLAAKDVLRNRVRVAASRVALRRRNSCDRRPPVFTSWGFRSRALDGESSRVLVRSRLGWKLLLASAVGYLTNPGQCRQRGKEKWADGYR